MEGLHSWKRMFALGTLLLLGFFLFFWGGREKYVLKGGSMTRKEFSALYGRETKPDQQEIQQVLQEEQLEISNVKIQDRNIWLTLSILSEGQEITIPGSLMASYKAKEGANCVYIQPERENGLGGEVLRIEIWNDTIEDEDLFVNRETSKVPHIKIYLGYRNRIYFFEEKLPRAFSKVQAKDYPKQEFTKEEVWAWGLTPQNAEDIPWEEGIFEQGKKTSAQPVTNRQMVWVPDKIHRKTAYINGKLVGFYSCPMVTYWYSNLVEGETANWKMGFQVQEYFTYDGQREYGRNDIYYEDVKLIWETGENTQVLSNHVSGAVDGSDRSGRMVRKDGKINEGSTRLVLESGEWTLSKNTYQEGEAEGHWLQAEGKVTGTSYGQGVLKISYRRRDRKMGEGWGVSDEIQLPYHYIFRLQHAEEVVGSPE